MTDPQTHPAAGEGAGEREIRRAIPEAGLVGRVIDRLGIVFALGIVAAMAILIMEVVLRYAFNAPTIWAHETTIFLCAIAFVYGGLYSAARDSHIRVVLIYDYVPKPVRRVLDVCISLVCMVAALFFAYASVLMVGKAILLPDGSFRLETSGSAWNPPTPALLKIFLLIVMGVMAIQFLVLSWNYARGQRANKDKA